MPDDPGVAVYFQLHDKERVLACDKWDTVADNIAAIAAHIDGIRRQDRYGVGTIDQAFAGYSALHWKKRKSNTGDAPRWRPLTMAVLPSIWPS